MFPSNEQSFITMTTVQMKANVWFSIYSIIIFSDASPCPWPRNEVLEWKLFCESIRLFNPFSVDPVKALHFAILVYPTIF